MPPTFMEWFDLALRWAHIFAGILWVGTTFYFTWLDGRFAELEEQSRNAPLDEKQFVWLLHSGGFYAVAKHPVPCPLPGRLHGFKWEAGITWGTGMLLFGLLFYHGGYLVSLEDAPLAKGPAIGLSVGLLLAGWVIYDLLWKFCRHDGAGVALSYGLIVLTAWVACHYFTGRAAYLQVGAMLGTIMAANVWMRIVPAHRRLVAALRAGQTPSPLEAILAGQRARHNTYLALPVVFTMISHHYPGLYGSRYHWLILSALVLVGWLAARIIRRA